ncbi:related to anther-expressed protein SLL2-S9 [Rhynchosporium secalis]|uniref:Protein-lysine N-methyltransferase EFM4 n=1 Tax=Rhynchosporium secalis TaxID=38038 RepID=A0A1E1MQM9_RHYSE|nr:related to anther-expressed protein SLL2-S9 [Rhynchosporium secalis]
MLHNSWDNLYINELSNHALDPTDEGTIWFDDSAAEDKVLTFLQTKIAEEHILGSETTKSNCSFLDLGTGNGHFLFALREGDEGDQEEEEEEEEEEDEQRWGGRLVGVDYSERSVEFAKRIAVDKGFEKGSEREVEFVKWDIMTEDPSSILSGTNAQGFDVVLDKGTFDAISLSEEKDVRGRRICEGYKERLVPLVREGGIFLVTSCNWTEEELEKWFKGGELEVMGRIEYRSFCFGGRKGQTISSVCFKKRPVP